MSFRPFFGELEAERGTVEFATPRCSISVKWEPPPTTFVSSMNFIILASCDCIWEPITYKYYWLPASQRTSLRCCVRIRLFQSLVFSEAELSQIKWSGSWLEVLLWIDLIEFEILNPDSALPKTLSLRPGTLAKHSPLLPQPRTVARLRLIGLRGFTSSCLSLCNSEYPSKPKMTLENYLRHFTFKNDPLGFWQW